MALAARAARRPGSAASGAFPSTPSLRCASRRTTRAGRAVATSRITWDCTTGAILRVEHRGNAVGADSPRASSSTTTPLLDHYFVTADAPEIAALDAGTLAGWQRTGAGDATSPRRPTRMQGAVCRFYLPPAFGDSHFYSASAQECADVRARFPAFVFGIGSRVRGAPARPGHGHVRQADFAVYRLWNARADSQSPLHGRCGRSRRR